MTAWKDWDMSGRLPALLPADTPSDRFGPLAGFVDIWQAKRTATRLPAWRDFDFYDFVGWHGLVYVDEVVSRDPLDLRCRLWGTRLVELLGSEETGKLLSQSLAGRDPERLEANRRIVGEGLVGLTSGRATVWERQVSLTVVKLPCAADGIRVDHILAAVWPEDPQGR